MHRDHDVYLPAACARMSAMTARSSGERRPPGKVRL